MKLAIERAALLRSLAHVQSVVERRTTIPILSNVKLEAEGGGLALTATDMDLSVVERAEAEVGQPGATSAPAHTLYDVVRKLPEGCRINLERSESGAEITLRAGRSTFDLPCLPAADFPAMTDEGLDHSFGVPAGDLKRLIDRTRFAISTEETRYYLNGIFLHAIQEGAASCLRSVATDGHRLARVETALPAGAEGMPPVIVPRKTVGEVRKLIDELDAGAEVEVALSSARIRFKVGSRGPALAPDRRHLPRLPAGDPERQRQAPGRPDQGAQRSGRPGRDDRDREGPRDQAQPRRRPG